MSMGRNNPREAAKMDPRRSLFFWFSLVAILVFCQFTVLTTRCFFDSGGGGRMLMQSDEETMYGGYPHINDAAFSALRATVSRRRPVVDPFPVDDLYRDLHREIDSIPPQERCAAFGVEPHSEPTPRRIFFGSMLADENMDILNMNAIETHGIYHVMAFVESNTTHMATPRRMRFRDTPEADLLQHSNMFGDQTQVIIDYWLEDIPNLIWMDREVEQRNTIVKIWKEAGMTERDIALMADVDEIVSRDFLRALQVCDFPQLRFQEEEQPSCQTPKMVLSTIQFEASPLCIRQHEWFHPDVMLVRYC
jgi:Glycosyltransferase family 17